MKRLEFKHNRNPRAKVSQNTNFRVFIQISRGIIDIFAILRYFWYLNCSRDIAVVGQYLQI